MGIPSLSEHDTIESACSVEWSIAANLLCCCTYQLDEHEEGQPQNRRGTVQLFKTDGEGSQLCLVPVHSEEMNNGILDSKWSSIGSSAVLGCVTSGGELTLHALKHEGEEYQLAALASGSSDDPAVLYLSLDWRDERIVVSESKGCVSLWEVGGAGSDLQLKEQWQAHTMSGMDIEAWIAFLNPHDTSTVVSGSDDALMKIWDSRQTSAPQHTSRVHDMGVTAGQWHPQEEHCFVTGSYDQSIRVWDARQLASPLAQADLGGGIWRLKWHPDMPHVLLAACMHGGVKVVSVGLPESGGETDGADGLGSSRSSGIVELASYSRHQSMAYGADWCQLQPLKSQQVEPLVIASCSFYDHLLCAWEVDRSVATLARPARPA
ncbi:unnamed protein product [Chrysoparadoxa australica]